MNKKTTTAAPARPQLPAGFAPVGGTSWQGGAVWMPHVDASEAAAKAERIEGAHAVTDAVLVGELRRVKAFGRDAWTIGGALVPDHGMLAARLATIDDGTEVAVAYMGAQKIERGQYRGKSAHTYQVGAKQPPLPF
jgi:hypothetical protein